MGLLLGEVFLHILPHGLEPGGEPERVLAATAFGVALLITVESFLPSIASTSLAALPAARTALVGDLIHHLVDGMIWAGAFAAGPSAGYAVLIAIALHEIPREMSSAAALVAMGCSPARAFALSVVMALAVPVAAFGVQRLSLDAEATSTLSAFAAGAILYVALADILPSTWPQAIRPRWLAPALGALSALAFMAVFPHAEHHN